MDFVLRSELGSLPAPAISPKSKERCNVGAKLLAFQPPDSNLVEVLRECFKINLYHYRLLQSCGRTTENPFVLRRDQVRSKERKTLNWLEQNRFVELNRDTESYELRYFGKAAVEAAPSWAQAIRSRQLSRD